MDHTLRSGRTLGASAMLLLGASVALTPMLDGYPVLAGQTWRYAGAAVLLLLLRPLLGARPVRPTRSELGRLVLLAAVGMAGFNVLLLAAAARTDPSLVAAVVGASPLVLALAGARSLDRSLDPRVVLGAAAVTAGVVVAQGAVPAPGVGLLLALATMACEVGFTLLAAPLLPRLGAVNVAAYGCVVAVPMLALGAALTPGPDLVAPTGTQLVGLLWSTVAMTALAFVLWYAAVARLGAARAGLLTGLVPCGALVGGVVLTGAAPAPALVLGVLVAGLGIAGGMSTSDPSRESGPPRRPARDLVTTASKELS